MDIFLKKSGPIYFKIRTDVEEFIKSIKRISMNPDRNYEKPELVQYLPIRWEVNQFYSMLHTIVGYRKIPVILVIVVNSDSIIKDAFFIENSIKDRGKKSEYIDFKIKFFEKKIDHEHLMKIQEKIKKTEDFSEIIKKYFSQEYNYTKIKTIIVPFNAKDLVDGLELPSFNTNMMEFCLSVLDIKKNFNKLDKKYAYILDYIFKNEEYSNVLGKFLRLFAENDITQWMTIFGTLLDDLMINFLVNDNNRIIFACRFIVENRKFTINPLPIHIYGSTTRDKLDPIQVAKEIYEKTGLRTLISPIERVLELVKKVIHEDPNLLDLILNIFIWSETSNWYPNSILSSFLRLFGFKLGEDIELFSNAFYEVIKNFEDILIATFRIHGEKDYYKSYQTFIHLTCEDQQAKIKLIDSTSYKHLLENNNITPIERLKKMREEIEKETGIHFQACLGFDINILAESISTKNLETILKIKNMARQLPFVASIGALFAGMKGLNVEKTIDKENALLEISEIEDDELIEKPLKFKEYFDAFLKKGILFISDEDKSMGNIRKPLYSKEGFLGMDLNMIRKNLENKKD